MDEEELENSEEIANRSLQNFKKFLIDMPLDEQAFTSEGWNYNIKGEKK